jgi:hypothetical protein
MQPKSIHDAAPGFRVLNEDVASAVVRRHSGPSLLSLAGEWDAIRRRPDRTINVDLYRRRIVARRRVAREKAALTSACVGALTMAAIYLALFFASAHFRALNDIEPAAPAFAIPNAADIRF